mgnify:CR=1 FL=1
MTDFGRGMAAGFGAELLAGGGVFVPQFVLRTYRALGLSDAEFMLLLQIAGFRQAEGNAFPTPDEIGGRMGIGEGKVAELIGGLIRRGFLAIDERIDPETGVRSEAYRWTGWYERAASMHASAAASTRGAGPAAAGAERRRASGRPGSRSRRRQAGDGTRIVRVRAAARQCQRGAAYGLGSPLPGGRRV